MNEPDPRPGGNGPAPNAPGPAPFDPAQEGAGDTPRAGPNQRRSGRESNPTASVVNNFYADVTAQTVGVSGGTRQHGDPDNAAPAGEHVSIGSIHGDGPVTVITGGQFRDLNIGAGSSAARRPDPDGSGGR